MFREMYVSEFSTTVGFFCSSHQLVCEQGNAFDKYSIGIGRDSTFLKVFSYLLITPL